MSPIKNWHLARRDLLKSLGVGAACLPLLRSSNVWGAPTVNKKLLIVATSEGYRMKDWAPNTGSLMGQTLPFSTAALEAVKGDVIIMPDLSNPGFSGSGGGGGHGSYGSIYWGLDAGNKASYKEPTGKTLDQQVAAGLPRPASGRLSIPTAVQINRSPQSSPAPGSSRCFWLGKGQPINPILDPYSLYGEIFANATPPAGGGMVDQAAVNKLMMRRKSILDNVVRELEVFKSRLGTDDRMAVDAHHQAVRDLETQLQGGGGVSVNCSKMPPGQMIDLNDALQYPNIYKAHVNLIASAFKCGVTQVATIQLSDSSGNNINFAFVDGIPPKGTGYKSPFRNYHDVGHNPVLGGVDHKRIVDRWMMQQLADIITLFKGINEDGGTMLDNSAILFGNHMQDGSNHDETKIPWVLAGKCGGYFATGQCPDSAGKPLNGVMTDICQAMGVPSIYGNTWAGLHKV
jgi:hypothetical protein